MEEREIPVNNSNKRIPLLIRDFSEEIVYNAKYVFFGICKTYFTGLTIKKT